MLGEATYPPDGLTYAASFTGVDVVCDRRLMFDRPSELPAHLLEAAAGSTGRVTVPRSPTRCPSTPWNWATKPCAPSSASSWKGRPLPEDVDPDEVSLLGFRLSPTAMSRAADIAQTMASA
ncbi:hypothetical protein ABTY59_05115 [Streptomyces sp. NPDC096079]|uniref:DUF6928 family protein n=1 Tax=Streptomyces sp. NPDC096079 TaxID=3155820 RepID=UPI00331BBF23